MEAHTRALRWVVGMFTHWEWTPEQVAASWRFLALRQNGSIRAIACHQSWSGWWGMIGADVDAALEAYTHIAPLGSMRHLEGELEHVEAMRRADPALRRRVLREEPSVALRRSTGDFRGGPVPGFRVGQPRDIACLQTYHADCPGPGRAPSIQELRRQIERAAVHVLEIDRQVVALCKVVPGGSHAYIRDVYTFPAFRRQGHARRLMEGMLYALAKAKQDACLCVAESNAAGLELYDALGFERWGGRLHLTLRATPARDLPTGG